MARKKVKRSANHPKPENQSDELEAGYIIDFVSGTKVRATPEELHSTQVFSRRLIEDFGYDRKNIITRPQYRVRRRPSDESKSFPVDIAVFSKPTKHDDQLLMVVECKAPNVKAGRKQLEIYLTMSDAQIGVWFNASAKEGSSHLYLKKEYAEGGRIHFIELPTLPLAGQRVEDIGLYLKRDLAVTEQLKTVLRDIRNHLAGMAKGMSRDEPLAQQIINILFCKVYDEKNKGPDELMDFRAGLGEPADDVRARILDLFANVKSRYDDVFTDDDTILLEPEDIAYVVGELQPYSITEAKRDVIGDAFEAFLGKAIRGKEGQFFTPRNVVQMMVNILDPDADENIIDPACGSGGFLVTSLIHVWDKVDQAAKRKKWSAQRIREEQSHLASQHVRGIDKDTFLAKVSKAYMAILGDGRGGVFCDNSLIPPNKWNPLLQQKVKLGQFDVLLTNPPFGTKIKVKGADILGQYVLGHQCKFDKESKKFKWTHKLLPSQPPQLLFIERCIALLKPSGRMGIILPESVMGMPTYRHIVQWLREKVRIVGVVSMPEELFQPHTHAKTTVVFIKNVPPSEDDAIFMSVVEWCGHDSRGNPTVRIDKDGTKELLDDTPKVVDAFREMVKGFK